jgi:3-oxoadipate enol-lactonase
MPEHDESGYIEVAGVRLFYCADGAREAPVVVCVNALGTDHRVWERQMPGFAERFRVIRYDSRGHGQSDATRGPYTLDQLGGDLLTLLDRLGIERAHVCGLSLGGMVAMWLAVRHPGRVGRVVLANTAARIGTEASWTDRIQAVQAGGMPAIREMAVARFLSEGFRREHADVARDIGEILVGTPAAGYMAACAALRAADLRGEVGGIRAPTLIIAGAHDESTPVAQARELQAAIAGSALVILDAAHVSNVEQAGAFSAHVVEFFSQP